MLWMSAVPNWPAAGFSFAVATDPHFIPAEVQLPKNTDAGDPHHLGNIAGIASTGS